MTTTVSGLRIHGDKFYAGSDPAFLDRCRRAQKRWPSASLETFSNGQICVHLRDGDWFVIAADGSYDTGRGGPRDIGTI